MPIRVRLALLFAAGTAVLLSVFGAVLVHELSAGLRSSVAATLRVRAADVSQALPDPGGGLNFQDSGQLPASPGAGPDQPITQVVDAHGSVVDSSGGGAARSLLTPSQLAQARRHSLLVQSRLPHGEGAVLLFGVPVQGRSGVVVMTGASLDTVSQAVHRVIGALVVGGPLAVLLAGLGAWALAGAALAPVERMRREADDISERDQAVALAVPATRDEIASLAHTLNRLLARLQGALNRQRGFVASASHELRTPLAILSAELELAGRPGRSHSELVIALDRANEETGRLVRLAEDLLILARDDENVLSVELAPVDVPTVLRRSVEAFGPRAEALRVELRLSVVDHLTARVDSVRLRQMVDNLVDNALRFAPPGSVVELRLTAANGALEVEVLDSGPGFPPEFMAHAFERFQRPDDHRGRVHGGAGLGLAIVRALVEAHGGRVTADNRTEGGASVRIHLPARGRHDGRGHGPEDVSHHIQTTPRSHEGRRKLALHHPTNKGEPQ
ncbi:MAG: two-component sensor histidine kinase [Acidimicrobiales bacterium]|nr:MAG: two-component sensor histidine kinase [Acidimicrobiales bacterium]